MNGLLQKIQSCDSLEELGTWISESEINRISKNEVIPPKKFKRTNAWILYYQQESKKCESKNLVTTMPAISKKWKTLPRCEKDRLKEAARQINIKRQKVSENQLSIKESLKLSQKDSFKIDIEYKKVLELSKKYLFEIDFYNKTSVLTFKNGRFNGTCF